jgi:hypothetical protein
VNLVKILVTLLVGAVVSCLLTYPGRRHALLSARRNAICPSLN